MPTLTTPPHLHDAWDELAAAPFVARDGFHSSMWDAMYALGSSGAFVVPAIVGRLTEEADHLERGDYDEHYDPDDEQDPHMQARTFRVAAEVLDYLHDRTDEDEDPAEGIAEGLRTEYGITYAYARDGAVIVPAP